MRDVHDRLLDALTDFAGGDVGLLASRSEPWASATFIGRRHEFLLRIDPAVAGRLTGSLPETEFALPGHLVADIVASIRQGSDQAVQLFVEALTIEAH